jgi:peptidoglycan/LPS O-acetylase OafA/YrhL
VTTPILVPLAWLANRRSDPGTPEPGESRLSSRVRGVLLGVGGFQTLVALALLLSPSTMIDLWPWMLTPLTAQTLGGWFALPGITAIMMGLDGRPSAIRITLQSQAIGIALILVAVARDRGSIDTANALSYVIVAGLAALLAGLLVLDLHMRRIAHGGL